MRSAARLYWGASVEAQTPLYFLPKEIGIKMAAFADAGNVWGYKGPTYWSVTGERLQVGLDNPADIRASVGVGLLWDSPLGPLRFDVAYPITTKYCAAALSNRGLQKATRRFATVRRSSASAAARSSNLAALGRTALTA